METRLTPGVIWIKLGSPETSRDCAINPTGGTFRRDGQPNEIDLNLSFVEFKTLTQKDIAEGF